MKPSGLFGGEAETDGVVREAGGDGWRVKKRDTISFMSADLLFSTNCIFFNMYFGLCWTTAPHLRISRPIVNRNSHYQLQGSGGSHI